MLSTCTSDAITSFLLDLTIVNVAIPAARRAIIGAASRRWIFLINLPVGLAAVVAAVRVLLLPRRPREP